MRTEATSMMSKLTGRGCFALLMATITIAIAFAGTTMAADFYSATTGNDTTGDGSSGAPWATIGKGMSTGVNAGDTVHVASGSYTGPSSTVSYRSGALENNITLIADGDVTIISNTGGGDRIFYPQNADYWTISGFTMTHGGTAGTGIGIFTRYGNVGWVFEDNVFDGLNYLQINQSADSASSNHIYRANTIKNIKGSAFSNVSGGGQGYEITGNTFLSSATNGYAIYFENGADNIVIANNVFYECGRIRLAYGDFTSPQVYNNTLYRSDGAQYALSVGGASFALSGNDRWRNNLIVGYEHAGNASGVSDFPDSDYEFIYSCGAYYGAGWPVGANDVTGQDPEFLSTDPDNSQFLRFKQSSPAASGADATYASYFGAYAPLQPTGMLFVVK